MRTIACLSLALLVTATVNVIAAEDGGPTYEGDIAPIFKRACIRCHSASARKGELDLSSPHGLFKGGESEATIVSGDSEASYLYELVHEHMMPPEGEGKHLSKQDVATIKLWLDNGTPFADGTDPKSFTEVVEVNQHDIRPIMMLRCTVCHGGRRQESGLDLRTRASMLKGGKSGPAMVLGKPTESLLLKRIHAAEMPPRDKLLPSGVKIMPSGELDKLTRWITIGAPEVEITPDGATPEPDTIVTDEDRKFWAFQSLRPISPPAAISAYEGTNAIDLFIAERLKANGLKFSMEASRTALVRRLYFDLIGLPPSPAEIRAFLDDKEALAYERLVQRLLASPRYGERWARFWLDAAGYADSEGKRSADPIRNSAWRYRDYVIRSMNADKPYSQFLLEQIAGDELLDFSDPEKITPQHVDNLIATGFLRMAPDGTGSDVVNSVPERMEVVADEIDIFSSTVLGLTMKCARCHSHKYDPIPQRDYYRLVATFQGAFDVHDWLKPTAVPGQSNGVMRTRALSVATPERIAEVAAHNAEIQQQIDLVNKKHEIIVTEVKAAYFAKQLITLPEVIRSDVEAAFAKGADTRDEVQRYLVDKFSKELQLTEKQLAADKDVAASQKATTDEVSNLDAKKDAVEPIRALWDRGEPSPTYLFVRGDFQQPGRLIGPGVPSVLTDGKTPFAPVPLTAAAEGTGRRLALAQWLIASEHPLTARVMVNRIWSHHFGRGIVSSIDNFGSVGVRPTHPELLDWLASWFIETGWSMKDLHRLMVTSRTYRQDSSVSDKILEQDPENLYLSHMNLRRLTAEEVRDSVIEIAGNLNQKQYGKPDAVTVRGDGLVTAVGDNGVYRRSVYLRQRRKEMPSFLETFDLPQMNPACQQRPTSNVAQQALYLLNSTMVRDLADQFALKVADMSSSDGDKSGAINNIYLAVMGQAPDDIQLQRSLEALELLEHKWQQHIDSLTEEEQQQIKLNPAQKALSTFGHALWNSAGFLYVD
jgi:cytochrome c553